MFSSFVVFADGELQIKNVIYMIPDGEGFALFDFTNAVKEAGGFEEGLFPYATQNTPGTMFMKDYFVGTVRTYSLDSSVTDSAAAGTALSSGYKTKNGYIGEEAFKVALDYAKSRTDMVVIVVPDHDTGGLNLPIADRVGGNPNLGDYAEAVAEVQNAVNSTKGVSWQTGGHTARRVGVWIYTPEGVNMPEGLSDTPGDTPANRALAIDNTRIALYLAELMGLDLQKATDELFVDVTDLGTYNPGNGTFTSSNANIKIVANQSVAVVNGKEVDLDVQIAVYSNGGFYVPRILLSMMN